MQEQSLKCTKVWLVTVANIFYRDTLPGQLKNKEEESANFCFIRTTGRGFGEREIRLGFIENCLLAFTFYRAH